MALDRPFQFDYIPGTTVFSNGQMVQFCAECLSSGVRDPKQPVTVANGNAVCIDHLHATLRGVMILDDDVDSLVCVVRSSLAHLPKTDDAVNQMIAQGIRSAYIRGYNLGHRNS